jgi:predicted nucleic acid-binding protein
VILDTNAISAWADGQDRVIKLLPVSQTVALPVVCIGEYLWGLRNSRSRGLLEEWLSDAINASVVLDITLRTTAAYAEVRAIAQAKGRPIPANDAWIAALALEHGMPVVSRDRHFDYIDGVERIAW